MQCLNKRLWYDYVWLQKKPVALCSNNAKSCYDWIVLLIAALCMCQLGARKPSILSMLNTIHGMKHHTWTAHGNSSQFASRTIWGEPIVDIGQGIGAGPAIWAAVSSLLFEIIKEEGFLELVHCAMSQVSRAVGGFAFVDDTDLCMSGPESSSQTAALMQQSVTTMEGLLWTTGGTLVPKKCFWYLIHIQWDNGRWHYEMARETWAELMVRNMARQRETVPQLEAHEAQWMLGICLAPDGNSDDEFQYLQLVAKEWKFWMEKSHLTHNEATFSLWSSILCKLSYPLAATTFSQQQCETIMWPILMEGLPKAECLCLMPWAVIHGPLWYTGANIPNLYTEQFLSQLIMVLRYGMTSSSIRFDMLDKLAMTFRLVINCL